MIPLRGKNLREYENARRIYDRKSALCMKKNYLNQSEGIGKKRLGRRKQEVAGEGSGLNGQGRSREGRKKKPKIVAWGFTGRFREELLQTSELH